MKTVDRPADEWVHIPVPAIISPETFERAAQRLADNKRFASRNSKIPSLLQGLAACSGCGYAYYRGHTTTSATGRSSTTGASAATTTVSSTGASAITSRSVPTTSTNSSGTTSPPCCLTPP